MSRLLLVLPLFQVRVEFAGVTLAVNVPVAPSQRAVVPLMVTVGVVFPVTLLVVLPLQPLASVPLTV